jgi:3-phytase
LEIAHARRQDQVRTNRFFVTLMYLPTVALFAIPFVKPVLATAPVPDDADDPAIWVNYEHPEQSRVIGTNKVKRPNGGLYVFDLQGKIVQRITGLDRPNNVDVYQGWDGRDIAVCTERLTGRLRAFEISKDGRLTDLSGKTDVAMKGVPDFGEPMGIALWRSKQTGNLYALVSPKLGLTEGYLEQYQLSFGNNTGISATFVGRTGQFRGGKEIESIATSNDGKSAFYSDETYGNRALVLQDRPNGMKDARPPINSDFKGDHEGIALYEGYGKTHVVFTDQLPGNSRFTVTDLNGKRLGQFTCGADETDGIEIEATPLGPKFPEGLMVVMDSKNRRFLYLSWRDVKSALKLK